MALDCRCNAEVDCIDPDAPIPLWEVTVTGLPPHDSRRVYQISGKNDTVAALEGMRRFVDEMEALPFMHRGH
jgi:hypothetical protein